MGISVKQNQSNITIALEPIFFQAERVIVSTQKVDENVSTTQEAIRLTKEDMYLNPSFMGESDVIRTVAASVGVTQFEGMQGMYVRGGSQEQNLVLFDNAIIYNPSHILGIFSVFNPDIVSSVSLYKSGIPAKAWSYYSYQGELLYVVYYKKGVEDKIVTVSNKHGLQ